MAIWRFRKEGAAMQREVLVLYALIIEFRTQRHCWHKRPMASPDVAETHCWLIRQPGVGRLQRGSQVSRVARPKWLPHGTERFAGHWLAEKNGVGDRAPP